MSASVSFGRYKGKSFDRSLGNRKFGKTTVDCGFLSSKSKWGTLEESPAGLLRLTLTIHEPAGFKLSSAEINLSFVPSDTGAMPNVTEHLYPDLLCGPPISKHKSRSHDIEPSVEAAGTSVGGIGFHENAEWSNTLRWLLRGSRLPDEQDFYTRAEWAWQANKLNEQSELRRAFQLAVVIAHSEPRVKVTVSVNGKLRQRTIKEAVRQELRRYKLINSEGTPKPIQLEFTQKSAELESIIKTLADEIANLNTGPVPEHTMPFIRTPVIDTPAKDEDEPEAIFPTSSISASAEEKQSRPASPEITGDLPRKMQRLRY